MIQVVCFTHHTRVTLPQVVAEKYVVMPQVELAAMDNGMGPGGAFALGRLETPLI